MEVTRDNNPASSKALVPQGPPLKDTRPRVAPAPISPVAKAPRENTAERSAEPAPAQQAKASPAQPEAPAEEAHDDHPAEPNKTLKDRAKELYHNKKFMRIATPIAIVVFLGLCYWVYTMIVFESTDDAYVTADQHIIAPRITGHVVKLLVNDNQVVKKGDILVQLDKRDFDYQVKSAQAALLKAQETFSRWKNAFQLDNQDKLQYISDQAAYQTAQANLENAQLQMEYTDVVAPEDGKIGARTVTVGEQVQAGQELMALMEMRPWIVANYKEGQLKHIQRGQPVSISVDAISGHTFEGHVDSVSPGSGAEFALLPPDNATGNFTKIVQRIPVKITIDADSLKGYEDRLAPGMSAEPKIRIR